MLVVLLASALAAPAPGAALLEEAPASVTLARAERLSEPPSTADTGLYLAVPLGTVLLENATKSPRP